MLGWRHVVGAAAALAAVAVGCKGDRGAPGPAGAAGPTGPTGGASVVAQGQNLGVQLVAARLTPDGHVQVDYRLLDAAGAAVDAATVTASWTAAVLGKDAESGLAAWQNLTPGATPVTGAAGTTTQPAADRGGQDQDLGNGLRRYTYGATLPPGGDPAATYRVGVWVQRPLPGVASPAEASDYDVGNGVLDFVPNGGTPQPRELVSTQACNACHGILQAHGGFRRDVRLCQTCHTTQLVDPDTHDPGDPSQPNPLDLGRLVHRIHRGAQLPTVVAAARANDTAYAYHVIGFRGSDNVYGAAARNPVPGATPPTVATGVVFPQDLRNCAACHRPQSDAQGNVVAGASAADWSTAVARRTCQGCHDSSWFKDASPPQYHVVHQQATNPSVAAGTNPTTTATPFVPVAGLPQADDSGCRVCHSDVLMKQHHTTPTLSPAFDPIKLAIVSAAASGGTLTVRFTAAHGDGSPITDLGSLTLATANASGPTSDFSAANLVSADAKTATHPADAPAGTYLVTLALPAGATGSWAVGMEARRINTALTTQERRLGRLGTGAAFYDFARNPVAYFDAGGGASATPRREVVTSDKCNACHQVLSVHGGLRHDPQYCVLCHAPDATDRPGAGGTATTGRPAGAPAGTLDLLAERSIHLKAMIHQIHTGEALELTRPFVIYGFGNQPNLFDDVRFPANRAQCSLCHAGASYTVDAVPAGAQPTHALQWTPATSAGGQVTAGGSTRDVGPVTAACVSCHDTTAARAHAQAQTLGFGTPGAVETCSVCHGEGAQTAVDAVHQQRVR